MQKWGEGSPPPQDWGVVKGRRSSMPLTTAAHAAEPHTSSTLHLQTGSTRLAPPLPRPPYPVPPCRLLAASSPQVHGTCLGMETLSVILSANYTILSPFDAEDAPAPLLYTADAKDSHLLRSLPADVVENLQNKPIAMENHGMGGWGRGGRGAGGAG